MFGAAALLVVLWLCALSDLLLHFGRTARVTSWLLLLAAAAGALWRVRHALGKALPAIGD